MNWELFAVISILTTSIAALLERVLMRDDSSNPISFAIVFQFLLGFITLCFALMFGKFILPHDISMWFRYIVSALLWAGASVVSLKAMKLLPVGEATIIGTTNAIVSIFLGFLIFGERLANQSIIGILLIFLAIWIVFSKNLSFKSKPGILFALLSAFFGGCAVINDMIILKTYEAFSYTSIISFLPGIVLLIIFPKTLMKNRNLFNRKTLKTMILLAVFYSIQAITYYLAIEHKAPISKLSPITKSSIILTVLLAALILKEKSQMPKKILAAIIVTIGAILVG
jgi:uncharacterized membrane protein